MSEKQIIDTLSFKNSVLLITLICKIFLKNKYIKKHGLKKNEIVFFMRSFRHSKERRIYFNLKNLQKIKLTITHGEFGLQIIKYVVVFVKKT